MTKKVINIYAPSEVYDYADHKANLYFYKNKYYTYNAFEERIKVYSNAMSLIARFDYTGESQQVGHFLVNLMTIA